jgi:uncharacterized OB-fold protein
MKKSCECQACGNIIYFTDEKCPYCGSANNQKYYQQPKTVFTYQTREQQVKGRDPFKEINWVIFIVLLIVFWPAAIVYLIVKSQRK